MNHDSRTQETSNDSSTKLQLELADGYCNARWILLSAIYALIYTNGIILK